MFPACFALSFGALVALAPVDDDPQLDSRFAELVRGAARFVGAQAQARENGVVFPEYAETPEKVDASLYSGTAGVLIFLENAAAVLEDEALRELSDRAAKGLLGEVESKKGGNASAGLYTGDAGIGHAFLVRARLRDSEKELKIAKRIGDSLLDSMEGEKGGTHWGTSLDIIGGGSGTVLFLLELAEESGDERYRNAALRAGRWLAGQGLKAEPAEEGGPDLLYWMPGIGQERHYPGFSHGTAGTAYTLARVADATGDALCLRAAEAGARWLLEHGRSEEDAFYCFHYTPGAEDRFLEGWCHGPAGTARLFMMLGKMTGKARYSDAAARSASWIRREWPRPGEADSGTRFYSPSLCCGAAGVLDLFVDLYRLRGQEQDREYARQVGAYLERLAKRDGEAVRWTNYDRPDEKGLIYHGVCLMIGTSGEALALLRLAAIDLEEDPVVHLPDRRVRARQ